MRVGIKVVILYGKTLRVMECFYLKMEIIYSITMLLIALFNINITFWFLINIILFI